MGKDDKLCAGCNGIITGSWLNAMGKTWHPEHFVCQKCKKGISGGQFNVSNNKPYCKPCFLNMFAKKCKRCEAPIDACNEKCIAALGAHWHGEHFTCEACKKVLDQKQFFEKNDHPYCKNCYEEHFCPKCKGCKKPISDTILTALDATWHKPCFKCSKCKKEIGNNTFAVSSDGQPLCEKCLKTVQKGDNDMNEDSSTHISYTSSLASSLLLKPDEISKLFRPDEEPEEGSIYLIEKGKTNHLRQKKFSVANLKLELLQEDENMTETKNGRCQIRATYKCENSALKDGEHDMSSIHVQKFVSKNYFSTIHNAPKQEVSLGVMGFGYNKPSWELKSLPKKKDLLEMIEHRIANHINPDITLIVGEFEFNCHRIVLQSYSELFDSMSRVNKIKIDQNVTSDAFFAIYHWMIYKENFFEYININNIIEVMIAAEILKIKELYEQCSTLLENEHVITEENAFFLFRDANRWERPYIKKLMIPRIQKFFLPLVSSLDFIQLNVEDLCAILESSHIVVHSELEVFMSAVRWLKSKWNDRVINICRVMQSIRFGLMTPLELIDIRKNPESPEFAEIANDKHVQLMIEDGLAYAVENTLIGKIDDHKSRYDLLKLVIPEKRNFSTNKEYNSYQEFVDYLNEIRTNPKRFNIEITDVQKIEVADSKITKNPSCTSLPGPSGDQNTNTGQKYSTAKDKKIVISFKKDSFEKAGTIFKSAFRPKRKISKQAIHIFDEKSKNTSSESDLKIIKSITDSTVFVFGGMVQSSQNEVKKSFVYRYDLRSNVWNLISSIPQPRSYHCCAQLGTKIFVVGGIDIKETVCAESWSFNFNNQEWIEEPSLLEPRHSFTLVSLNGFLYAIGGEGIDCRILSSVERYDPKLKIWKRIKSLPKPCIGGATCIYKNCIWLAGGMSNYEHGMNKMVYCYDPKEENWIEKIPLRFGRAFASLFHFENTLYIIGGAACKSYLESVDSIDAWNELLPTWKLKGHMPIPRHGHTVAILDKLILIIGGTSSKYGKILNDVDVWYMERNNWTIQIPPVPSLVIGHSSVAISQIK